MRSICNCLVAAFLLGSLAVGCKPAQTEPAVPDAEGVPSVPASASAEAWQIVEGELQYEDLEGGTWRLRTAEQVWVLRAAAGGPSLEAMLTEAKLQSGAKAAAEGRPASAEENFGINMAGPYFEVRSLKALSR